MSATQKNIRVLIVEDSENDALLILRQLKQGGYAPESLRVDTRETLEQALRERTWDIVLSDYKMPGFDGAEALKVVQETGQDIPFIVISGTIGEATAVAMMKAGAHDFLLKDALGRLVPAVERELREADVRREKRSQLESLRESEEKFSKIFRQAPLLLTLSEIETGVLLDVNDKFLEISGFTREEAIGKTVLELGWNTPEQRMRMRQELREKGHVSSMELTLRSKAGKKITCLYNGELISVGGRQRLLSIAMDISERKQAEQLFWESRAKLKLILDTMPQAVFWKDVDSVYLGCNDNFAKAVGLSNADEIRGKTDFDLPWPKTEAEAYRHDDREVITGKRAKRHIIEPLLQSDGTRLWIDTSKVPLVDQQGNVYGVLGVYDDITERKNAEAALKESEHRLKTLLNAIPDAVIFKDAAGRHIIANRANERLFGLSPEMMIGRTVEDLLPADLAASCRRNDDEVLRTKKIVHLEEHSLDTSGQHQVLDTIKVPLYDDSGSAIGLVGIVRDITESKHSEEKIRQSEEFIRGILDTVDEGFIVVDRDYRIMTANKAYCSQAARSSDDVIGRHCYEISHHISRPCYEEGEECAVKEVFATGTPHAVLHKHRDRDGRVLYVETKGFPIKDASGAVTSVIETITNITEKHLLEEERLKTQKLESIGMLAGGIAHDFNNLLQGIFGYISMAKLTLDQREKSLAMLEQAEKALHQSVSLTSQLLTFSKGGKPVKKNISLTPVIENAAKFALSGSRSGCQLEIAPGLWDADADAGQVGQVIQNIVLNADQAMPLGGSVTISARNLPTSDAAKLPGLERKDHIVIAVEDQGVGIPEAYLDKIFDPYFTTKEKGSGLGLATSYSIIRNHGGRIDIRSTVGKGSTFLIYLPAVRTEASLPEKQPQPAPVQKARVLVMDDEELIRKVAEELLRSLGHEVTVAENGDAAIEKYERAKVQGKPFDAVILDLTIRGGKGGAETMRALLDLDPDVNAIVSSGYSDDEIIATYRQHGFRAFLKKPYHVDDLARALADAGRERGASGASPEH